MKNRHSNVLQPVTLTANCFLFDFVEPTVPKHTIFVYCFSPCFCMLMYIECKSKSHCCAKGLCCTQVKRVQCPFQVPLVYIFSLSKTTGKQSNPACLSSSDEKPPGASWSYTYPAIYKTLSAHCVTQIPKQIKDKTKY